MSALLTQGIQKTWHDANTIHCFIQFTCITTFNYENLLNKPSIHMLINSSHFDEYS